MKKNHYISCMKTTVDTNEIKKLHPTEHSKIVKAMAKKGVAETDIEWKYRLTKQEIEAITKGKIFTFGINF